MEIKFRPAKLKDILPVLDTENEICILEPEYDKDNPTWDHCSWNLTDMTPVFSSVGVDGYNSHRDPISMIPNEYMERYCTVSAGFVKCAENGSAIYYGAELDDFSEKKKDGEYHVLCLCIFLEGKDFTIEKFDNR